MDNFYANNISNNIFKEFFDSQQSTWEKLLKEQGFSNIKVATEYEKFLQDIEKGEIQLIFKIKFSQGNDTFTIQYIVFNYTIKQSYFAEAVPIYRRILADQSIIKERGFSDSTTSYPTLPIITAKIEENDKFFTRENIANKDTALEYYICTIFDELWSIGIAISALLQEYIIKKKMS